jgi:hypothetical protein
VPPEIVMLVAAGLACVIVGIVAFYFGAVVADVRAARLLARARVICEAGTRVVCMNKIGSAAPSHDVLPENWGEAWELAMQDLEDAILAPVKL